jgi:hypothetical protein
MLYTLNLRREAFAERRGFCHTLLGTAPTHF